MSKILYIAGYGRSGSTILDIILSGHEEITGVGEATFILEDWANSSRLCSCGKPYQACEFWQDLFPSQEPPTEMANLIRKIEQRSSVSRLLLGRISHEDRQAYASFQGEFFRYILSQAGSSIVVDSSKSARSALGRFFALSKIARQDVYVLHLVRDGMEVMESQLLTGDNWVLEGRAMSQRWLALRTALGWVTTNIWVPLMGRLIGPNRYLLLRYEDFTENPAAALQAVGRLGGFDATPLIERIEGDEYFDVGHMVGGNRVRLQGKVKLKRRSSPKYGARLKAYQRVMFTFLSGWLQYLYGYR